MSGSTVSTLPAGGFLFAPIDVAGIGDNTIVAGVPGKKFQIANYAIVATLAVAARWKSGATTLSGAMSFAANGGIACPGSTDTIWFETGYGEALILNASLAVQLSGHVTYRLVG